MLPALTQAWGPVPKSAGRRNLRAATRASAVMHKLVSAWIGKTSEVVHYIIMITDTLFNTQPYSVGHALMALTTVLVKETARHIPPCLRGAVAVALTGHVWRQFCLANTSAILRFAVLNPTEDIRDSRFKRSSRRRTRRSRNAPSCHHQRRVANSRRTRMRAHERRTPRSRKRGRPRHAYNANQGGATQSFTAQAGDVDSSIPLGREDDVEALHCLDEELNVIMGSQAGFEGEGAWSDEEWNALRSMLKRMNGFMARTATDLPGYTGEIGKFDIPFKDESASHYQKPRWFSPAERGLIDDHFNKLLEGLSTKRPRAAPEQYVYKRMPFGSTNSTAMFGRVIEHELRGLSCAKVYCDDILVTSITAQQHIADLDATMERLSKVGLRGHPGKSVIAAGGCEFLGFLLRPGKLSPHQAKVAAIRDLPTPTDVRGVRAVLGFMNFYRIMAARIGKEDYSTMAWPLNCLLRKGNENIKAIWGKEHDDALAQLKERLIEPGVVVHAYNPEKPLYLMTDWAGVGISAILGQKDDEGQDVIIAATSRTLSRSEVSLQEFEYDIVHRAGSSHTNADVLSRYPRDSCLDPTGASLDPTANQSPLLTASTFACVCARHPRDTANETMPHAVSAASWQYEWRMGSRDRDPCTGEDLAAHHMGDYWACHSTYVDLDEERGDSLWSDVCEWVAQHSARYQHITNGPTRVLDNSMEEDRVISLNTQPVPRHTIASMHKSGAVVVELCAGICSGLEACLITGGNVKRYVYCDNNPTSRQTAQHRLTSLHNQYPSQLPLDAMQDAFTTLPKDLRQITPHHLATLATEDEYVFAVVGTECQDLSSAGSLQGLQGLQGKHSSVLYDVVNVLGQLQRMVGQHRFVYLIECVAAQHNFNSRDVREVMHPLMCSMIGIPITIDAAQLGARAHRLRNYWSNMGCPISAQQVLTAVVRDPNRLVIDILDPGRAERPTTACATARGHYRCNVQEEPMRAWPTMMSFADSYQFRGDGKGTVWDDATQTWVRPRRRPEEKEGAMGFQTGATEAPGVTARQRGEMLGRAFDVRAVSRIMATCYLLNKPPRVPSSSARWAAWPRQYSLRSTADATAGPRDSDDTEAIPSSVLTQWAQSLHAAQDDAQMDSATLRRLYGKGATPSLMEAAQRHAPTEAWQAPYRGAGLGAEGSSAPATHDIRRPVQFVRSGASAHTTSAASTHYVHSRDTSSDLPATSHPRCLTAALSAAVGARETREPTTDIAMIQWLQGQRIGSPEEQQAAALRAQHYALEESTLVRILPNCARRPVPPVDQRTRIVRQMHERLGHFGRRRTAAMVRDAFYWPDLMRTCVEVVSTCDACTRYRAHFDNHAPHLNPLEVKGMCYRFSTDLARMPRKAKCNYQYVMVVVEHFTKLQTTPQESTRISPYELVYAQRPTLPLAIKERISEPLDSCMDAEAMATSYLERAEYVKRAAIMAGSNIAIAQHRQTERYAQVRSGKYLPKQFNVKIGDFIFLKRSVNHGLQLHTREPILQIAELHDDGTVIAHI
ncbi:hypothetical protein CYMTET_8324 [Cymbomonas tetramitiformis]|uniref:Polyprotein n=1 Tax=Cymbomonas tetramitiformis TaxID=36881 RepID=A0AAE0GT96_9CHLO|nr:hypothetical protein CYMTET_8324 [Cymbomonas tetramitiformis]